MRRDGERDSGRAPAPEDAEVTALGNVDQKAAGRRRDLGAPATRVDADEPVLVEVDLRHMLIGYARDRVSKADGQQSLDLQHDELRDAGVAQAELDHDLASGVRDDRPGLECLRALRKDDALVVWKLDPFGRNLAHLVNTVQDPARGGGLLVLASQGAQTDTTTTTTAGRLASASSRALDEFERELIRERTMPGQKAARARGRKGGRKFALPKAQVRLAQAANGAPRHLASDVCRELGIKAVTLYRHVGPQGQLREQGEKAS